MRPDQEYSDYPQLFVIVSCRGRNVNHTTRVAPAAGGGVNDSTAVRPTAHQTLATRTNDTPQIANRWVNANFINPTTFLILHTTHLDTSSALPWSTPSQRTTHQRDPSSSRTCWIRPDTVARTSIRSGRTSLPKQ